MSGTYPYIYFFNKIIWVTTIKWLYAIIIWPFCWQQKYSFFFMYFILIFFKQLSHSAYLTTCIQKCVLSESEKISMFTQLISIGIPIKIGFKSVLDNSRYSSYAISLNKFIENLGWFYLNNLKLGCNWKD